MTEQRIFKLKDFPLQCGITLPEAHVAYACFGELAPDKSNAVIYPTSYGITDKEARWLVKPDGVLDPTRLFIVILNQFGNGASTSPSTLPPPFDKGAAPPFTHYDNARAQERLMREVFGVERIRLAYGWSMGAQQCLHWGALFPGKVQRILAICGAARTAPHAKVFVDSMAAILKTDAAYQDGWFRARPDRGLRSFARAYAAWGMCQAFYRERLWEGIGYASLEDYVVRYWEGNFAHRDGANLLSMLATWRASDISDNPVYGGDLDKALGAIEARVVMAPSRTDLYFPTEDNRREIARMRRASLAEIDSDWGHRAGHPEAHPPDAAFLREQVEKLLAEEV